MKRIPHNEQEVPLWRRWVQGVLDGKLQHGLVWDDVQPTTVSVGGGSATPTFAAYEGNFKAYRFGTALAKNLVMEFQFPHARKDESAIVPHLHLYVPDDATGGTIKFTCEYTWDNVTETGAKSSTTVSGTITRTASQGIARNEILSFGEISGTGKGLSSILSCVIERDPTDPADTFGSAVWLKSADVHAQRTWWGSVKQFLRS